MSAIRCVCVEDFVSADVGVIAIGRCKDRLMQLAKRHSLDIVSQVCTNIRDYRGLEQAYNPLDPTHLNLFDLINNAGLFVGKARFPEADV